MDVLLPLLTVSVKKLSVRRNRGIFHVVVVVVADDSDGVALSVLLDDDDGEMRRSEIFSLA